MGAALSGPEVLHIFKEIRIVFDSPRGTTVAICRPYGQPTVVLVSKDVTGQRLSNLNSLGIWLSNEREQPLDSVIG